MRSPHFLQRPLLVSVSANRWKRDVLALRAWPSAYLLLTPPRDRQYGIPFFAAAADPERWPAGVRTAIGASVLGDLHDTALEAIAEIARRRSGTATLNGPILQSACHRLKGRALADWLIEFASDGSSIVREVPYLFTSGAHRARAIATALTRIVHRPIARLADNGAAVGMISWMLGADLPGLQQVELLEPDARFRLAIDGLWQKCRDGLRYIVAQTGSEQAQYAAGTDLIMFCHCLLRIKPSQRRAVLERAWAALPQAGILLVNEALRDDDTPRPGRQDMVHREELIAILPGRPQLFREQTGWRTAEDLHAVDAAGVGYSGIILSVRE
jgi:hypothetical protein